MPGGFSQERHAGAGRTLDVFFPESDDLNFASGTAFGVAHVSRGRGGLSNAGYIMSSSITGTGAVRWLWPWNGRGCIQVFPGAAGTASFSCGWAMNPNIGVAAANSYRSDPLCCMRFMAVMSFAANGGVGAGITNGWQWVAHNVGNGNLRNGASGFGFIQTAAAEISFARRAGIGGAGGLLTETPVLQTTVPDLQNWHVYEIRVIGATATTNAQLKAFIDGVQCNLQGVNGSTLDWIADGLATPQASNGVWGLRDNVSYTGAAAAATGLLVHRLFMHAAPTEVDLL